MPTESNIPVKYRRRYLFPRHAKSISNPSKTPEYIAFYAMHARCKNPECHAYKNYGGRGIKVCTAWDSFDTFLADMGPRPSKAFSLERVNNDGDYGPENCKWATIKEQSRNKRNARKELIAWNGASHTLAEWAEIVNIDYGVLFARLRRYGWAAEAAFTLPVTRRNCRGHARSF